MRSTTHWCGCRSFVQADDGIRGYKVTGVQTCALPIFKIRPPPRLSPIYSHVNSNRSSSNCAKMLCVLILALDTSDARGGVALLRDTALLHTESHAKIGRASCRKECEKRGRA